MALYHIGKNNKSAICKAKPGNCPVSKIHFDSRKLADEYVYALEEKEFGLLPQPRKTEYDKGVELYEDHQEYAVTNVYDLSPEGINGVARAVKEDDSITNEGLDKRIAELDQEVQDGATKKEATVEEYEAYKKSTPLYKSTETVIAGLKEERDNLTSKSEIDEANVLITNKELSLKEITQYPRSFKKPSMQTVKARHERNTLNSIKTLLERADYQDEIDYRQELSAAKRARKIVK